MRLFIGLPGPFAISFGGHHRWRPDVARRSFAEWEADRKSRRALRTFVRQHHDEQLEAQRVRLAAPCPEPAHLEWARPRELRLGEWIEEDGLRHIVALRHETVGVTLIFADGTAWHTGNRSTVNKVVDDANGRTGVNPLSHKGLR